MNLMDLVYNRSSEVDDLVVFAERELAEAVSTIRVALRTARTWGEFAQSLPEGEWAELLERLEEAPDAAAPFDADEVPGHADGDYPTWLAARMVDIIPTDVVTKYGSRFDSVLNGEAVERPWAQADEIAADIRRLGHRVELRTDLDLS